MLIDEPKGFVLFVGKLKPSKYLSFENAVLVKITRSSKGISITSKFSGLEKHMSYPPSISNEELFNKLAFYLPSDKIVLEGWPFYEQNWPNTNIRTMLWRIADKIKRLGMQIIVNPEPIIESTIEKIEDENDDIFTAFMKNLEEVDRYKETNENVYLGDCEFPF